MPRDLSATGGDAPADLAPAASSAEHQEGRARVEAKAQALDAAADRAKTAPDRPETSAEDPESGTDRPEAVVERAPVPMTPAARKAELLDQIATRPRPSENAEREQQRSDDVRSDTAEPSRPDVNPPTAVISLDSAPRPERMLSISSPVEQAEEAAEPPDRQEADSSRLPMGQGEFWERYPGEYLPPDQSSPRPDVRHRFQSPGEWVAEVNPNTGEPGRVNCGECCRSTELNWRGIPTVAGVLSDSDATGEQLARMEDWADGRIRPTDFAGIKKDLLDAGPSSSALVIVMWDRYAGHWFNAVNDGGRVVAVDGQSGRIGDWPPDESTFGFSESDTAQCGAIVLDPDGNQVGGYSVDK